MFVKLDALMYKTWRISEFSNYELKMGPRSIHP